MQTEADQLDSPSHCYIVMWFRLLIFTMKLHMRLVTWPIMRFFHQPITCFPQHKEVSWTDKRVQDNNSLIKS